MTAECRLEQIEEAMGDLEFIFADPTAFGAHADAGVADYGVSLASEFWFAGRYHDDYLVGRLERMAGTDDPRAQMRHLVAVRKRLATRLSEWERDAEKMVRNATKPQVAATSTLAVSSEAVIVADGVRMPISARAVV